MSTYDYYRIFYHVAQHHSFTKAAEVLHNNQPNITRCMNNLETELGCHLFVRSNRGVSLTPEGQKLFNHVAIAFEQLELGEAELKRDQSLTSGLISIGVSENALRIMLLSKLEAFHNHYPPEIFIFNTFLLTGFRSVRILKLHPPTSAWL